MLQYMRYVYIFQMICLTTMWFGTIPSFVRKVFRLTYSTCVNDTVSENCITVGETWLVGIHNNQLCTQNVFSFSSYLVTHIFLPSPPLLSFIATCKEFLTFHTFYSISKCYVQAYIQHNAHTSQGLHYERDVYKRQVCALQVKKN